MDENLLLVRANNFECEKLRSWNQKSDSSLEKFWKFKLLKNQIDTSSFVGSTSFYSKSINKLFVNLNKCYDLIYIALILHCFKVLKNLLRKKTSTKKNITLTIPIPSTTALITVDACVWYCQYFIWEVCTRNLNVFFKKIFKDCTALIKHYDPNKKVLSVSYMLSPITNVTSFDWISFFMYSTIVNWSSAVSQGLFSFFDPLPERSHKRDNWRTSNCYLKLKFQLSLSIQTSSIFYLLKYESFLVSLKGEGHRMLAENDNDQYSNRIFSKRECVISQPKDSFFFMSVARFQSKGKK